MRLSLWDDDPGLIAINGARMTITPMQYRLLASLAAVAPRLRTYARLSEDMRDPHDPYGPPDRQIQWHAHRLRRLGLPIETRPRFGLALAMTRKVTHHPPANVAPSPQGERIETR